MSVETIIAEQMYVTFADGTILGKRDVSLKVTPEKANITTGASKPGNEHVVVGYEWSADVSGAVQVEEGSTGATSVLDSMLDFTGYPATLKPPVAVACFIGGEEYDGSATVGPLTLDGKMANEGTFSFTLEGTGLLVKQ